jgi:hypothetical protein
MKVVKDNLPLCGMFLEILSRLEEIFNHFISIADRHLCTVALRNQVGVLEVGSAIIQQAETRRTSFIELRRKLIFSRRLIWNVRLSTVSP